MQEPNLSSYVADDFSYSLFMPVSMEGDCSYR
jgi:hypothetical protein